LYSFPSIAKVFLLGFVLAKMIGTRKFGQNFAGETSPKAATFKSRKEA
jgi:hypothetical protein